MPGLAVLALFAAAVPTAVVLQPVANMYSRPSLDADVVSQAIYGANVGLLEQKEGWAHIRTADDYTGWTPLPALLPGKPYATSGRVAEVESLFAHIYREASVTKHAPLPDKNIFALGVPVLGICYGVQIFAHFLGGKVEKGLKREYGKGTLTVKDASCALFTKLPRSLQVWNSHGDKLTKIPAGFKPVAVTENSEFAAIEHRERRFFGLQFHPEVVHTPRGREIYSNFVHGACRCGKDWTMRNYAEQAVEEIRAQVGKEHVVLGLSGGVDSSVAAALLHKAIGDQLTCIFVKNGRLRPREAEVVQNVFARSFKIKLQYVDASKIF